MMLKFLREYMTEQLVKKLCIHKNGFELTISMHANNFNIEECIDVYEVECKDTRDVFMSVSFNEEKMLQLDQEYPLLQSFYC